MKKQIFLLTIFITLLYSNILSQTVYITKSGEKYHNQGCRYLNKSAYSINLSDAIAKGYTACKICKPSTAIKTTSNKNKQKVKQNSTLVSNSNSSQSVSVQCTALTKKGTRCKRMTKNVSGRCWQHN